jgi:PAS domain S-box-containing protein
MAESLKSQENVSHARKSNLPLPSAEWIESMFESFIDSIEVGVFVLDTNAIIRRVNKYMLEQYPWPEELIGQNIFELMPDLADLGVEKRFKQVIEHRRTTELTNIEHTDQLGHKSIFNLKGIPILEGNEVRGVFAVTTDITEKRALQSQVAETEEYLKNLIDYANDFIYTLDSEGYITFFNKMTQEATGYQLEPNERAHYSAHVLESSLPEHEMHFREAITGKPQRYESTIVGMENTVFNVLINLTPIRKGEAIVGVLGIARDITERKQMEAQLLQAGKMAAIGELASGVAHEINNPVAIIGGTAEQLQFLIDHCRENPEEISKRLLKHVETISEQAARCKKITQALLNFARKTEIRTTEVSLARLLEETIALVGNRAMSEGKKILLNLSPDLPTLSADPHQLEQVFLNIVNNALDAVDKNGSVAIKARTEGGSVIIDFMDDGIGIPEENLKKIFDPFFTTKPLGKGTGLGLSICIGIVQRMNGTISVDSRPHAGTTFTVRLPLGQHQNEIQ